MGSRGTTEARGTAPVTGDLGTSPTPLLGLSFLILRVGILRARSQGKKAGKTPTRASSRNGHRLCYRQQQPRGLGLARSQPRTPGRAPALPTLSRATRSASPPAGLLGSPRPSCRSAPHQAHFFPKVRQATRPIPEPAPRGMRLSPGMETHSLRDKEVFLFPG